LTKFYIMTKLDIPDPDPLILSYLPAIKEQKWLFSSS